jgi:SAM-dependent methyltransferase
MFSNQANDWDEHWRRRALHRLYPSEIAVRAFLQNAPGRTLRDRFRAGDSILDIGFGDGRNFGLFSDLGLRIHGTEISSEIVEISRERFGDEVETLDVGHCSRLPFSDRTFDIVYAVGVLFYGGENEDFQTNLSEVARVSKSGGHIVFTLLREGDYLLTGSVPEPGGVKRTVLEDPSGVRVGETIIHLETRDAYHNALGEWFDDVGLYAYEADWFGLNVSRWYGVARVR